MVGEYITKNKAPRLKSRGYCAKDFPHSSPALKSLGYSGRLNKRKEKSMRKKRLLLAITACIFWAYALHAAPFAYVANYTYKKVSVVDLATKTVIKTIDMAGDVFYLAITPDNKTVYVPINSDPGFVQLIDIATNTVIPSTIATSKYPYGIAITPDGTKAFVTNPSNNPGVTVIKLADKSTTYLNGAGWNWDGPCLVAITPDSKYAYVTNQDGNFNPSVVTIIDVANNTKIGTINIGNGPVGVAITPDGKKAFVANNASIDVTPIDLTTNPPTPGAAIPMTPGIGAYTIAIHPMEKRLM